MCCISIIAFVINLFLSSRLIDLNWIFSLFEFIWIARFVFDFTWRRFVALNISDFFFLMIKCLITDLLSNNQVWDDQLIN
jgi:hypothetical protein